MPLQYQNVSSCKRSSSHVSYHHTVFPRLGILRFSFFFFSFTITTHWKIQPCYSFSRLVSGSVTVGQLLPTRMIFNKLLYWPSEGRWQQVVLLSWCRLGQWIFTRSTPGQSGSSLSRIGFPTLAAAGQVTPLPLSLADPRDMSVL